MSSMMRFYAAFRATSIMPKRGCGLPRCDREIFNP
jgi:hypothetical protein